MLVPNASQNDTGRPYPGESAGAARAPIAAVMAVVGSLLQAHCCSCWCVRKASAAAAAAAVDAAWLVVTSPLVPAMRFRDDAACGSWVHSSIPAQSIAAARNRRQSSIVVQSRLQSVAITRCWPPLDADDQSRP